MRTVWDTSDKHMMEIRDFEREELNPRLNPSRNPKHVMQTLREKCVEKRLRKLESPTNVQLSCIQGTCERERERERGRVLFVTMCVCACVCSLLAQEKRVDRHRRSPHLSGL